DTMLREAAARSPDALPLLEFALEQLYRADVEAAAGRVLRLATYNGLGRLEGAIAAQAETAVGALPDDARAARPACRRLHREWRRRCAGRCFAGYRPAPPRTAGGR